MAITENKAKKQISNLLIGLTQHSISLHDAVEKSFKIIEEIYE